MNSITYLIVRTLCACSALRPLAEIIILTDFKEWVEESVHRGDLEMFKHCVSVSHFSRYYCLDWEWCAIEAVARGHLNILKYTVVCGTSDWVSWMTKAIQMGHLHIVQYICAEHIGYFGWGMKIGVSCFHGYMDETKYAVAANVAHDWNVIMNASCFYGRMGIVEYAVANGADDWNASMCLAAQSGHIHIVRYLVSKGADNWDECINEAIANKHHEVADFLQECKNRVV